MESNNQENFKKMYHLFRQLVELYKVWDKLLYSYDIGQPLRLNEVHTIAAIGDNDQINITKLAAYQKITKGAVSQMIRKLVRKNLVIKRVSPETENEVVLSLTESGEKVYQGHKQFHESYEKKIEKLIEQQPPGTVDVLINMATGLQQIWEGMEKENRTLK